VEGNNHPLAHFLKQYAYVNNSTTSFLYFSMPLLNYSSKRNLKYHRFKVVTFIEESEGFLCFFLSKHNNTKWNCTTINIGISAGSSIYQ
jgi:hypothetical protein